MRMIVRRRIGWYTVVAMAGVVVIRGERITPSGALDSSGTRVAPSTNGEPAVLQCHGQARQVERRIMTMSKPEVGDT